jgi:hypothetical protein
VLPVPFAPATGGPRRPPGSGPGRNVAPSGVKDSTQSMKGSLGAADGAHELDRAQVGVVGVGVGGGGVGLVGGGVGEVGGGDVGAGLVAAAGAEDDVTARGEGAGPVAGEGCEQEQEPSHTRMVHGRGPAVAPVAQDPGGRLVATFGGGDLAVRGEQQQVREHAHPQVAAEAAAVEGDREAEVVGVAVAADELADLALAVGVDADDLERRVTGRDGGVHRHLGLAHAAPGGPEDQEVRRADEVGAPQGAAVEEREREVRHGIAGRDRGQGRPGAGDLPGVEGCVGGDEGRDREAEDGGAARRFACLLGQAWRAVIGWLLGQVGRSLWARGDRAAGPTGEGERGEAAEQRRQVGGAW